MKLKQEDKTPGIKMTKGGGTEESATTPKTVNEQFKDGPPPAQQQAPMTKEETIAFYSENLPFMRIQDEYEELVFKFRERKVKDLELRARELETIGYLSRWKQEQDESHKRQEAEEKMKAEWEAMTPEQQDAYRKEAQANLESINAQAKQVEKMKNRQVL